MGFWWARQAFLESLHKPITVDYCFGSLFTHMDNAEKLYREQPLGAVLL
jgi:hypothetical protein